MDFTCPYCNHPTTITPPNMDEGKVVFQMTNSRTNYDNKIGINYQAIICPNTSCKELFLAVRLSEFKDVGYNTTRWEERAVIDRWKLLPDSTAKPQPNYIPQHIVKDYIEACKIKDLSPKASATLARRALQGMIRDFWGIKKSTLKLEIDELQQHVSNEAWEAIDAVRSVGNIGAHMEKDVNVIVDIEKDEADLLIQLIEDLFIEWYVSKHDREERKAKLKSLAAQKQTDRKQGK